MATFVLLGFADGIISWYSRLQRIVSLSTTIAENMSIVEASKEATWKALLCSDLGLPKQILILHYETQEPDIWQRTWCSMQEPDLLMSAITLFER